MTYEPAEWRKEKYCIFVQIISNQTTGGGKYCT